MSQDKKIPAYNSCYGSFEYLHIPHSQFCRVFESYPTAFLGPEFP